MFLQAGFPLKITLYQYAPAAKALKVLGNKGETLDLSTFLEVTRSAGSMIVVVQTELKALLSQSPAEWESFDRVSEAA
jgi:hypothetical protein